MSYFRQAREMMAAPLDKLTPAEQSHAKAYRERQRAASLQALFWLGAVALPAAFFLVWITFVR